MNQITKVALTEADREGLFRTIIETAVDGIIVIDSGGTMVLFNDAAERLFGYAPEEVLGHNISMLMPEPHRSQHDAYISRYLAEGGPRIIGIGREVPALRKDGSTFPMYLSVGEGLLGEERIFLGIIHDLTDRKAREAVVRGLQNELLHASRMTAMGQLTSALAHELNQPLTAVMNYMNAARRGLESSADPAVLRARELLEKAVAQTGRAGQIIRRLRDFIEKKEPNRSLEDLNASVEEAVALGLVGAAADDIVIETRLEPDLPQILFDRIQIQQVIVNLLRNAVEAMEGAETRKIVITTARLIPACVEIAVCDNGPGISPDIAARLFQPFSTTKAKGMGMGLSICKAIIEAHGGRLWAAPNPGGGAQFHFRLPVDEEVGG
jgi:two-component system sensor kinase FixL